MATQRRRKHPRIEVAGEVWSEERIPRWELELLAAALKRLASGRPVVTAEVEDARK
jgi:hypothetical protein